FSRDWSSDVCSSDLPGVVLGRDQWLYSDEEFNPIVNEELNLQGNYALVEGVRQALKAKGVKLVMAIVPAKTRLYPEHLGEEKPRSEGRRVGKEWRRG